MAHNFLRGKVSVIIPAYNSAFFIGDAIESVLQQTFKKLEIIVVDDGSSDNTLAVLQSYRDRITVLCQSNAGPSAARNRGLSVATGEYAYFLDSDDMLYPEALQQCLSRFHERPDISLVAGSWEEIDGQGTTRGRASDIKDTFKQFQDDWVKASLQTCCFPVGTVMVRLQCVLDCGGWDETLWCAEDRDLWLRLALEKHRFGFVPARVARYRRHSANSTRNVAKMEEHILRFLNKWFERPVPPHPDAAQLKPYAYGLAWLFLAAQCREAGLETEMLRCINGARDWFLRAEPDEGLIQRVLWEVYEKPGERAFHSVLWPKARSAVAELCWVHGRQALRRREPRNALLWFMTLARNHPGHFASKLRRLLKR